MYITYLYKSNSHIYKLQEPQKFSYGIIDIRTVTLGTRWWNMCCTFATKIRTWCIYFSWITTLFFQKAYCTFRSHKKTPSGLVSLSFTVVKHRNKNALQAKPYPGIPQESERSIRIKINLFWCFLRNLLPQPKHQQELLLVLYDIECKAPITSSWSSLKF